MQWLIPVLLGLWLAGLLFFWLRRALGYARLTRLLRDTPDCKDPAITEELRKEAGYRGITDYIAVKLLPEPHFFFLEIPCTEQEAAQLRKSDKDPSHYNVYYLDGCTEPVTQAIIKRYGELLINDGLTRFGFGSNSTGEEIYVLDYQQINVYSEDGRFDKVYKELGVPEAERVVTPWENFTPDNVGISMAVEIEGEQCSDIPLNLKKEGMYLAETRENI